MLALSFTSSHTGGENNGEPNIYISHEPIIRSSSSLIWNDHHFETARRNDGFSYATDAILSSFCNAQKYSHELDSSIPDL